LTVRYSFYAGSVAFLCAVLWTIFSTKEHPPKDMAAFAKMKAEKAGLMQGVTEIIDAIVRMPRTMRQLAWVQLFTWLGLFCMWLYFPVAVAHNVFGAVDENSPRYAEGTNWGGLCFAMYSVVTLVFSFGLVALAQRFSRKTVHSVCLVCGALGLISVAVIHNKYLLFGSMTGVGIAWASILCMPYAMLAGALPAEKTGVYMGIFNLFIVLPEIAASLGFGWIMENVLKNNRLAAVVAGGVFLLVAAILALRVNEEPGGEGQVNAIQTSEVC
jgi:maltose/moltooligosaccharide transporter